jgi:hypothetical protein
LALCGIGDGYLAGHLAHNPPRMLLGEEQPVVIIEPDLHLIRAVLSLHDYSHPEGPIAQPRFRWYAGEDWATQLEADYRADRMLPLPTLTIGQSVLAGELEKQLQTIGGGAVAEDEALRERVESYYADLRAGALAELFGAAPQRRPRVMFLTTRFSTVLQYSTADAARGFEELGWEARVMIEPSPRHRLSRIAMRQWLAEFKPDLVFQIDHLRHEHGGMFPENLPFVCWIQDHKENLTQTEAGAKIGAREFVLTGAAYRYTKQFAYPARQVISVPKVTRVPQRPLRWECDGPDLVYVSHCSHRPEDALARVLESSGINALGNTLIRHTGNRLIEHYAQGKSIQTNYDMRRFVQQMEQECGIQSQRGQTYLVHILYERLNSPLYRQQALTWAARLADREGLKLAIYGKGWEKHPTLGRFAAGEIEYGPALEALSRRAKILLQLEPYACYTHQRMLDCLVAGGFALVREHLFNTLPQEIGLFLNAHLPRDIETIDQARQSLAGELLEAFEQLMARSQALFELGDPVEIVRGWQNSQLLSDAPHAMPHLPEISFQDEASFGERVMRFVADRPARSAIAEAQRRFIENRLTYSAALRRAVGEMQARLAGEESHPTATRVAA